MASGFSLTATAEPEVANSLVKTLSGMFGLLLIVGVGVGLTGFVIGHEHIYNNTREVPWGLLISTYAFFAITSTGLCLLAAISHVFGGNKLAPLANRMVWISLITIISGFLVIGMEIVSPWRMLIYNVISPNITSNIWWMGTLYGLALGFIVLEFWLILTRHYTLALVLGILGALAEVAANTTLGGVFPPWLPGRSGTALNCRSIFSPALFSPERRQPSSSLIMPMSSAVGRWNRMYSRASRLPVRCCC
jgi:Ni/Fe-hydrogenase subunit HybB-like protein